MQIVLNHYHDVEKYAVENVGARESYDVRATRGVEELHIEVKGSSGLADKVELTFNEVAHAYDTETYLVIVGQIQWRKLPDGTVEISGGRARRWTSRTSAEEHLTPSRYWYRPPAHIDELLVPRQHIAWSPNFNAPMGSPSDPTTLKEAQAGLQRPSIVTYRQRPLTGNTPLGSRPARGIGLT
ncbi:DUF3883 domain-containing protein [Micromonospora sp. NPDC047074]|uniref:protein NO VEIN domain-containing protein n=1 Tax=Micromonospora sp. NPDC047074 TaxID=3154339 RepID=UPI0033FC579A